MSSVRSRGGLFEGMDRGLAIAEPQRLSLCYHKSWRNRIVVICDRNNETLDLQNRGEDLWLNVDLADFAEGHSDEADDGENALSTWDADVGIENKIGRRRRRDDL